MRRLMRQALCALALFAAACAVAPARLAESGSDGLPDPGLQSPLRHPV